MSDSRIIQGPGLASSVYDMTIPTTNQILPSTILDSSISLALAMQQDAARGRHSLALAGLFATTKKVSIFLRRLGSILRNSIN